MSRAAQGLGDSLADDLGALRGEMHPVAGEWLGGIFKRGEQVDKDQAAGLCERTGGLVEFCEPGVEPGVVGDTRVSGLFERGGSDYHEPGRHGGEVLEQCRIGGLEIRGRARGVKCFNLAEPREHHRGASADEVLAPRAPFHHAVLPEDRITFPTHVAEFRR